MILPALPLVLSLVPKWALGVGAVAVLVGGSSLVYLNLQVRELRHHVQQQIDQRVLCEASVQSYQALQGRLEAELRAKQKDAAKLTQRAQQGASQVRSAPIKQLADIETPARHHATEITELWND